MEGTDKLLEMHKVQRWSNQLIESLKRAIMNTRLKNQKIPQQESPGPDVSIDLFSKIFKKELAPIYLFQIFGK